MNENKTGLIIVVLVLVILILLGIVVYAFIINPAIDRYIISTQNQGIDYALAIIVQQVQQNGYVQIPVGNQTLILVPVQPQTQNILQIPEEVTTEFPEEGA